MGSIMTSRQAAELDHAFERNGFTPELVKKLSEGNTLRLVREVLLGRAEIKHVEHFVNFDRDSFVPQGYTIVEHKGSGQFKYDSTKVKLYLSEKQKNGKTINGDSLCRELKDLPVVNANLLDFLLKEENQYLIPDEWKGKVIFFWGTIYKNVHGDLFIRCLYWDAEEWISYYQSTSKEWYDNSPAVILVG